MQMRRALALATGALILAPALAGCADSTNRIYTPAAGVQNRETTVDVLGAVIVSAEDGAGTFIATFVNNSTLEPAAVTSVAGTEQTPLEVDEPSIEIPPRGAVNLADDGGLAVSGDFVSGDFVTVVVEFDTGESAELDVPVVTNCGIYAGLDGTTSDCESSEPPVGEPVEPAEPVT